MADYRGFDLTDGIGSLDSSSLVDHVILRAAYNADASRFELLVSNLYEGQDAFAYLALYSGDDPTVGDLLARLATADATYNNVGTITINDVQYQQVGVYTWDMENPLLGLDNYDQFSAVLEGFTVEQTGEEIIGIVQWPHLDCGALGVEKSLIGFDLVADAPEGVNVSIGFDQRNQASRTANYLVDADTLPGKIIPIPVSGPSFDLKLTMQPGQQWEVQAANLYLQDWRPTA